MTAKEYLQQIVDKDSEVKAKRNRLQALREAAASPQSPDYSDLPKNSPTAHSHLEDMIMLVIECEEELDQEEQQLKTMKLKAAALIMKMKNAQYQTILIERYLNLKSWDDIASQMYYTKRWLYKMHSEALDSFDEILREDTSLHLTSL